MVHMRFKFKNRRIFGCWRECDKMRERRNNNNKKVPSDRPDFNIRLLFYYGFVFFCSFVWMIFETRLNVAIVCLLLFGVVFK